MNSAAAGVVLAIGRFGRNDRARLTGVHDRTRGRIPTDVMIAASHRPTPLVVVVMTTEHEIDAVAIEQWQPGLANSLVGAIAFVGRAECVLMHLYDDPINAVVLRCCGQSLFQPARLRSAAVTTDVERGAGLDWCIASTGSRS